ncbi:MAG TPA: FAD-dependent monooxygenase [Tianweitania sediminis]|nr:FAD-dependent monooxygenase [Tianweitania sediminis]
MLDASRPVLIAGGGLAGLTTALAFAATGTAVRLFEAAPAFGEIGAGLQLSPNATHILDGLGVLPPLESQLTRPSAVTLFDAATLRPLTAIPLGAGGEKRWRAPYVVAHRAAILDALLATARRNPLISIETGALVRDLVIGHDDVTLAFERGGSTQTADGAFLVAADGVWSGLRQFANGDRPVDSRFSGLTAWRTTLPIADAESLALPRVIDFGCVSTFLDPYAHLVAYPLAGGSALNLVAITRGGSAKKTWREADGRDVLDAFLRRLPQPLNGLARLSNWTRWPLYEAPADLTWVSHRFALVGDAAHALLPFAAQGAAMAIEDAAVLAASVQAAGADLDRGLQHYQEVRRRRLNEVRSRGRLNRLAWHAGGPVALARNLVFRLKGPEALAADLDWLYGWREPTRP